MIDRFNEKYTKIDDLETILDYLYKNPNGFDNQYTIYRRNNYISDIMEVVDITSMSGEELVNLLYRIPLYIKGGEK